jgi:hypothetical protein
MSMLDQIVMNVQLVGAIIVFAGAIVIISRDIYYRIKGC